jgi:hypothetical protein
MNAAKMLTYRQSAFIAPAFNAPAFNANADETKAIGRGIRAPSPRRSR